MRSFATLALIVCSPSLLAAQAELVHPEHWRVRPDRPEADASDVYFVEMPPGWHVTTGPAVILWNPESEASGRFRVEAEIFSFDPEGRREAFGLFLGGRNLDSSRPEYLYFLVREGGEFLVKRREGGRTHDIVAWTRHDAVHSWASRPSDQATARNVLTVDVDGEDLRFSVNGDEVARVPCAGLPVEGRVGLRVNHHLNLHVSRLEVIDGG